MPRLPIDYANTIIYKIVCNDLNITECYVGHTTDIVRRKYNHKNCSVNEKSKDYNTKLYKTIREKGGFDNYSMIEIEKYPCKDVQEAKKKKGSGLKLLALN
jgi:predicted GIY-YIG superfamily endonuclease